MKKLVLSILLIFMLCISVVSCSNIDFKNREGSEKTRVFYGVAVHVKDFNHTCLYFPETGHMTMPMLKSGESSPNYKAGDLIKITFTVSGDIPIMESFPGQFGAAADEILIKKSSIGYSFTEDGIFFSDKIPDDLPLAIGDKLIFNVVVENEEKNIAEGEITEISNDFFTTRLINNETDKEFLKFIFENDYSVYIK